MTDLVTNFMMKQFAELIGVRQTPTSYVELCRKTELVDEMVDNWLVIIGAWWLNVPSYGYTHLVFADFNFENRHIEECRSYKDDWIEECKKDYAAQYDRPFDAVGKYYLDAYVKMIDDYLNWLTTLPEVIRSDTY